MLRSLVGSEMCIRDSSKAWCEVTQPPITGANRFQYPRYYRNRDSLAANNLSYRTNCRTPLFATRSIYIDLVYKDSCVCFRPRRIPRRRARRAAIVPSRQVPTQDLSPTSMSRRVTRNVRHTRDFYFVTSGFRKKSNTPAGPIPVTLSLRHSRQPTARYRTDFTLVFVVVTTTSTKQRPSLPTTLATLGLRPALRPR